MAEDLRGTRHPRAAHDRRGDGGRERGPALIPDPPDGQATETARFLKPVAQAIENVRLLAGVAFLAVVLVLGGALLERYLLKQRLQVLEGAQGDVADLDAAAREQG